ncbi:MAG: PHP domain-containing protein [Firmicutes bacterium]|nr:PHP domain-containing protein [Bacillota bacterium]
MLDAHIHFHKQPYTEATIENMVAVALSRGVDELHLLDHTHKFSQFDPLYECTACEPDTYAHYVRHKRHDIGEYLDFVEKIRRKEYPVRLRFGLEVCYFPQAEQWLRAALSRYDLDFYIGSVHHIDGFAFDFAREDWAGRDVDALYRRYYAIMLQLIESGLFGHLAHPDSIKIFGFSPSEPLSEAYEAVAYALAEAGMSTENNAGFARYGFTNIGLAPEFHAALRRHGVTVYKASDAHIYTDIGAHFDELAD